MKTYRITVELKLNDNSYHPRKWVPEAIWSNLETGEDIVNWEVEEVNEPAVDQDWVEP